MTDILIIEDNPEIGSLLCDFLKAKDYQVMLCDNGEEGLRYFLEEGAKLILLDLLLPGIDGLSFLRTVREKSSVPVLIVSARTEKDTQIDGLNLGADDYIEKPYDIDILFAKIDNLFKRRLQTDTITSGNLTLDKARRLLLKNAAPISMSAKEFELLSCLMENSGRTLSKDFLFYKIWGADSFSEPQTLTVHINYLREKIEDDPKKPRRILTVWGVGYRFEEA